MVLLAITATYHGLEGDVFVQVGSSEGNGLAQEEDVVEGDVLLRVSPCSALTENNHSLTSNT